VNLFKTIYSNQQMLIITNNNATPTGFDNYFTRISTKISPHGIWYLLL